MGRQSRRYPAEVRERALRGIRNGRGPNADTPVIAFTVGEGGGDLQAFADFDGFAKKPAQATSLLDVICAAPSGAARSVEEVASFGN
jgi:hypothetical protein